MSAMLATSPADAYACEVIGLSAKHPDGRIASLDSCFWAEIAPCGCISGMTTAVHIDAVLRTPEQALRDMCETATQYWESVKQGSRMICVLGVDYRGPVGELFRGDCPHTPKWGITRKTREVGGVEWERIHAGRWATRHADKCWSIEKWSSSWHLEGPTQGPGRYSPPWLGVGKLDDALQRASDYILSHPEGLERVS